MGAIPRTIIDLNDMEMNMLVCTKPGNLEYGTSKVPEPQPGRSLLRIKRIGICGTDLHAYEGTQPFFNYPRVLGHELAAEIVNTDHPGFSVGEAVTFIPYYACGTCVACRAGKPNCCVEVQVCGVHIDGGMVEYLSVPSSSLIKGEGLALDDLAIVEPLAIGAHGIRRAEIKKGEFVLVMGAGPIGLGLMEFARIEGAKVIAMDVNNKRLEFCRERFKVDYTVNAAKDDVSQELMDITNNEMPTVVIDATGSQKAINNGFNLLAHGGRYVLVGLQKEQICFRHPDFHKREATLMSSRNATKADFDYVVSCIRKGVVSPSDYITHKIKFHDLGERFASLLEPENGIIKAMVEM